MDSMIAATAPPADPAHTWVTLSSTGRADELHYKEEENLEYLPGFIFLCSRMTKPECYRYRVFGLPRGRLEVVEKIRPGSKLFLFDFELKLLYGVYEATSTGEMDLEPFAFSRKFPVQVKFRIYKECLPLREKFLRQAIKDNYEGSKFKPELTEAQVRELISLFRPLEGPSSSAHEPSLFFSRTPRSMPNVDPYIARTQLVCAPPTVNPRHRQDVQLLQRTRVEHQRQLGRNTYGGSGSRQSYFGESIAQTSVGVFQRYPSRANPYDHYSQYTRTSDGHGQVITVPQNRTVLAAGGPYTASYSQNRYLSEGYPIGMTTMNDQKLEVPTATYALPDAAQQYYHVGVSNVMPEASSSSWTGQRATSSGRLLGSGINKLPQQERETSGYKDVHDPYNPTPQSHQIELSSVYSLTPQQDNQTVVHQNTVSQNNYYLPASTHPDPFGTQAVQAQTVVHQSHWMPQAPHNTSVNSDVQPQTISHQEAVAPYNYRNNSHWMPTPYVPQVVEQQDSAPYGTQEVQLQYATDIHQSTLVAHDQSVYPYSATGVPSRT